MLFLDGIVGILLVVMWVLLIFIGSFHVNISDPPIIYIFPLYLIDHVWSSLRHFS